MWRNTIPETRFVQFRWCLIGRAFSPLVYFIENVYALQTRPNFDIVAKVFLINANGTEVKVRVSSILTWRKKMHKTLEPAYP